MPLGKLPEKIFGLVTPSDDLTRTTTSKTESNGLMIVLTLITLVLTGWAYFQVFFAQEFQTHVVGAYLTTLGIIHLALSGRRTTRDGITVFVFFPATLLYVDFIAPYFVSGGQFITGLEPVIGVYFKWVFGVLYVLLTIACVILFIYWGCVLQIKIARELFYRVRGSDPEFSISKRSLGRKIKD